MSKTLIQVLFLHLVAIAVLLFGLITEPRDISLYLAAEIAWLILLLILIAKSKERRLLVLLSLPILCAVEGKLFFIAAMSFPYIFERLFSS